MRLRKKHQSKRRTRKGTTILLCVLGLTSSNVIVAHAQSPLGHDINDEEIYDQNERSVALSANERTEAGGVKYYSGEKNLKEKNTRKYSSKRVHYLDASYALFSSATYNIEFHVLNEDQDKFFNSYLRIGIGFGYDVLHEILEYRYDLSSIYGPGVNIGYTFLSGKQDHHFELSTGAFLGYNINAQFLQNFFIAMPILDIGYRYQPKDGGLILRANIANLGLGVGVGWCIN